MEAEKEEEQQREDAPLVLALVSAPALAPVALHEQDAADAVRVLATRLLVFWHGCSDAPRPRGSARGMTQPSERRKGERERGFHPDALGSGTQSQRAMSASWYLTSPIDLLVYVDSSSSTKVRPASSLATGR